MIFRQHIVVNKSATKTGSFQYDCQASNISHTLVGIKLLITQT